MVTVSKDAQAGAHHFNNNDDDDDDEAIKF